jgi:hypothetical protein
MKKLIKLVALAAIVTLSNMAIAGPVFLTGHDPDFHAQLDGGAANLLRTGLDFVTGGTATLNDGNKFLWVESRISPPAGHLVGEDGLGALGLTLGVNYDRANALELASVTFSDYTAIAVASSFGALLTRSELDALIARKADIETFINAGGGLFAGSECYPCGANLLAGATAPDLFGFLPVVVTSIGASSPFTATPYGTSLGLVDADLNSPTHNSFGLVGGLNVVDTDSLGNATTLAGDVNIDPGGGGFTPVPAPGVLGLMILGLFGLTTIRRILGSEQSARVEVTSV